ncbi:Protein fem-1 C [Portunus trituberculatus]|uniref:Protein fem-1 C n=1 Tax=Portunus trituberculatus TaxID=210409 RepID=A0A5B7K8A4_PORTR|nr:Protein fem-1 C [Portunus trituberculatus]
MYYSAGLGTREVKMCVYELHKVGGSVGCSPSTQLLFQMLLDHRSRSEASRMVCARTNGATPLVMAAKNGHLACVEYLVERCGADLEQVGSGQYTPRHCLSACHH